MLDVINALIDINKKRSERDRLNQRIEQLQRQEMIIKEQIVSIENELEKEIDYLSKLKQGLITNIVEYITEEENAQKNYSNQIKYVKLQTEYKKVCSEIVRLKKEVKNNFEDIEEDYKKLVVLMEEYIIKQGGEKANKIKNILSSRYKFELEVKEYSESIKIGRELLNELNEIREKLESVQKWAQNELEEGNLISKIKKLEYIEEAQEGLYRIQWCLRQYHNSVKFFASGVHYEEKIMNYLSIVDNWIESLFLDETVTKVLDKLIISIKELITNVVQIDEKLRKELEDSKLKVKAMNIEYEKLIGSFE